MARPVNPDPLSRLVEKGGAPELPALTPNAGNVGPAPGRPAAHRAEDDRSPSSAVPVQPRRAVRDEAYPQAKRKQHSGEEEKGDPDGVILDGLTIAIAHAQAYAEQWEEAYR